MSETKPPHILVVSSLFPSQQQSGAGLFIRERMFRVGQHLPLTVVSPVPWFPFQGLLRKFYPNYRPVKPYNETMLGIEVYRPRFCSVPMLFRHWDGFFMAVSIGFLVRRLKSQGKVDILDAHFAYPDGYAASLVGQWFNLPVTITLRGTEVGHSKQAKLRPRLLTALQRADHVFAVADSLKQHMINLGADGNKITVVGNGVDTDLFYAIESQQARVIYQLPNNAKVLISVGGLTERKGFHRVIACFPELLKTYPNLHYLVVGGASPEGDWDAKLKALVTELSLENHVHFLGFIAPNQLYQALSAADVFVLSTRNEGWANVFLEAMACGLPVVTTDVGGNAEVVNHESLGRIVTFEDHAQLVQAIKQALAKDWDKQAIIQYAKHNSWQSRIELLLPVFNSLVKQKVHD